MPENLELENATKSSLQEGGRLPCHGSELGRTASIAAIDGYLKNRYLLCDQLSSISSTYDREKDRRKCLESQIEKIDRCVIEILHAQNDQHQATASIRL